MKYRVTNWPEHDRALVRRGDVTVWFAEDILRRHWRGAATGKRGAPLKYSNAAIQALSMLKVVFGLPYRALEGFARSLLPLLNVCIPVNVSGETSKSGAAPEELAELATDVARLPRLKLREKDGVTKRWGSGLGKRWGQVLH